MAGKTMGLGRGLGALLDDGFDAGSASTTTLPLSQVECFQDQPRKYFDETALAELAESIREHGIIQPLTVRKLSSGYYQIIAGERRWRAARIAGLTEVPVVVMEVDDRKALELAMVENLQREDLNPMEEAEGFRALMERYEMTQEQAASRVGKSRSAVANALRLLTLSPTLREMVETQKLSAGHARALLSLDQKLQEQAAKTVIDNGLSVRQTEQLVKRLQADKQEKPKKAALEVDYVAEAERDLTDKLGRACHIVHGPRKGRVELEYYGVEDLNALLEALSAIRGKS